MGTTLFLVKDPLVVPQYKLIGKAMRKHKEVCAIAYQSNWYMIIACMNEGVAYMLLMDIASYGEWQYEIRAGKKTEMYYIRLRFNR